MICYKDMTFCSSNCVNTACSRHYGPEQREGAKRWWGSDDAPVAFSDFSDRCDSYEAPPKQIDKD